MSGKALKTPCPINDDARSLFQNIPNSLNTATGFKREPCSLVIGSFILFLDQITCVSCDRPAQIRHNILQGSIIMNISGIIADR